MREHADEARSEIFILRVSPPAAAAIVAVGTSDSATPAVDIECNKQNFAAQSEHFAAMFSSGFSEGSGSTGDRIVNVVGDAEAYRDLKRYVHAVVFRKCIE